MRLISVSVSPLVAASAQSIYAFGSGLALVAFTYLSGLRYDQLGALVFVVMALFSGIAIPVALTIPLTESWKAAGKRS
jgi:MFS transporter, PPP family, 3-phenylpropionic acid transporter